jgi:hypothetical protein
VEIKHFDKIINLIFRLRDLTNIFDLLVNENLRSNSEETLNEIEDLKPIIQIRFEKEIKSSFYKEIDKISVERHNIVLNCFYNKNDDVFSVNLKSSVNQAPLSGYFIVNYFSTLVNLKIYSNDNKVRKVFSLNENDKIFHNIFYLKNFSKVLKNYSEPAVNIKLIVHIQINYIQTMVLNYILHNANSYFHDSSATKLSKTDLELILKHKFLTKSSEDQILELLMNWRMNFV